MDPYEIQTKQTENNFFFFINSLYIINKKIEIARVKLWKMETLLKCYLFSIHEQMNLLQPKLVLDLQIFLPEQPEHP